MPFQPLNAVGIMGRQEEDGRVAPLPKTTGQPNEWVHVALAAEGDEEYAKWAGQGLQRRSSAGSAYSF